MLQNFKTIKNKFDGEKMDDLKQTKNEDKKPALINLTVYDDSSFLSPYSSDNEEIISDEVAGFLENSAKQIKPTSFLKINIKSKTIAENEKPIYLRAIKNYYENESAEIKRNLKFTFLIDRGRNNQFVLSNISLMDWGVTMQVGINVTEDSKLYMGESLGDVLDTLDNSHVAYKMVYDKEKNGIKESVIDLKELHVTLQLKNDILEYIRMNNNKFTFLGDIDVGESVSQVREIDSAVIDRLGLHDSKLTYLKIDLRPMHIVIVVNPADPKEDKIRVAIEKDSLGRVHISTLSILRS